jgi:dTDP-4-dehydrorhamnose reductase
MSRRSYYDPDLIVPARRYEMGWEAARPKYTVFDCAKIQRLTRWVAPSWKDALAAEINMPEEEDVKRGITV